MRLPNNTRIVVLLSATIWLQPGVYIFGYPYTREEHNYSFLLSSAKENKWFVDVLFLSYNKCLLMAITKSIIQFLQGALITLGLYSRKLLHRIDTLHKWPLKFEQQYVMRIESLVLMFQDRDFSYDFEA